MLKFASALLLIAATFAPAHAATTVILSPPNTTTIPSYTTAMVIQNFNTPRQAGSPFLINTTNTSPAPNSPAGIESINAPLSQSVTTLNSARSGLNVGGDIADDYLRVSGNNSSYTISFDATPVAFFSFAFNNSAVGGNFFTLTYVGGLIQQFNIANNFGHSAVVPSFGRLSYDVGTGPKIVSATFGRESNAGNFSQSWFIDDIAVAAPEPAAWLMMILGFGLVGSKLRRRRSKARTTFAAT